MKQEGLRDYKAMNDYLSIKVQTNVLPMAED